MWGKFNQNASRDRRDQLRAAVAKVDRLLSEAQDVIGSELSVMGLKEEEPYYYYLGDEAYTAIEQTRRGLRSTRVKARRGRGG